MITQMIVTALLSLVGFLLGLLPDDTVDWPDAGEFGAYVGNIVGPLDSWLPIHETVEVFALTVTVVLPALFIYRLSMWLWTLLPDSVSGQGPS